MSISGWVHAASGGGKHSCPTSSFIRCQRSLELGPSCARGNKSIIFYYWPLWQTVVVDKNALATVCTLAARTFWIWWYIWPWHCSTDVKSEWCTLGNAWVAAGRQITELSPNENYLQIIPHSELSSNYLWIARQEPMVVLVLCHEIFIISCFNPLSVAACLGCPWNANNWMLNIWLWHQYYGINIWLWHQSSGELSQHWQRSI